MTLSVASTLELLKDVVAGAHMGFFEHTDTLFDWSELNYVSDDLTL